MVSKYRQEDNRFAARSVEVVMAKVCIDAPHP
jgi:hypothetical protein